MLIVSFILWLYTGLIHIYFIDGFLAFIDAQEGNSCWCDAPLVKPLADDADPETIIAHKAAED